MESLPRLELAADPDERGLCVVQTELSCDLPHQRWDVIPCQRSWRLSSVIAVLFQSVVAHAARSGAATASCRLVPPALLPAVLLPSRLFLASVLLPDPLLASSDLGTLSDRPSLLAESSSVAELFSIGDHISQ